MFADKYLAKNKHPQCVEASPEVSTGIIVVIPCLSEPYILETLESIYNCTAAECVTEVIVVVNHSEDAPETIRKTNKKTVEDVSQWISGHQQERIRFYVTGPLELRKKWAGAGLARKFGMDEAARRFNAIQNGSGIIVSLDADTLVEKNYLLEIERHFKTNPKNVGATISFNHQKKHLNTRQLQGIELYELYLKYYKSALEYTGYPFSMFTIGSAFAVTAAAYVKRGGMNRRQAGEDFYFLQNLVQIGKVGEISGTCVYPSARLSDRVPFGTGPILAKWMKGDEDLTLTYDFDLFADLKLFFDKRGKFFRITDASYLLFIEELPASVTNFLKLDNFWLELKDLNNNCATEMTFQKRFFQKFSAFKILKYLNYGTEHFYPKSDLTAQIEKLQSQTQK